MRHLGSMQASPAEQWGTLLLVRADGAKRFQLGWLIEGEAAAAAAAAGGP
jgi:hypothetical protein